MPVTRLTTTARIRRQITGDDGTHMSLFQELQRRNVFRVSFAYVISAWLLAQVADLVLDNIAAPDWVMQTILLVLVLGLAPVVFFSWAYEVTPEGVKRESEVDRSQSITHRTGQKLNRTITVVLFAAVAFLLVDKFLLQGDSPQNMVTDKSVAVLPFVAMSRGEDDEYFADGLTEEILNSLTRVPELLVTARTSAFHFKGQDIPIPEIAAALGVAFARNLFTLFLFYEALTLSTFPLVTHHQIQFTGSVTLTSMRLAVAGDLTK